MNDNSEELLREDLEFLPLFSVANPVDAIFLKEVFDTEKITVIFDDQKVPAFPTGVGGQAEVLISVDKVDFDRAKSLIESAIENRAISEGGSFVDAKK